MTHSYIDKHIALFASGCSFTKAHTKDNHTWLDMAINCIPFEFEWGGNRYEHLYNTIHSCGRVSAGNYYIIEQAIQLLKSIKTEHFEYEKEDKDKITLDKYAIIQLSGLNRYDYTDNKNWYHAPAITRMFDETVQKYTPLYETGDKFYKQMQLSRFKPGAPGFGDGNHDYDKMKKADIKIKGKHHLEYWQDYFSDEYSTEKHLKDLLENIIKFQDYCKKENIPHRFFLAWDIFTSPEVTNDDGSVIELKNNLFSQEHKYKNSSNGLLIQQYPHLFELWTKVDWNKFWFFNNDDVIYGGMNEWIKYNIPRSEDWYLGPNDAHPSNFSQEMFFRNVIVKLLVEMVEEKNR